MSIRDQLHSTVNLALTGVLTGILVLTGCSSFKEKECRSADWRMIGYEDAVSGQKLAWLANNRPACTEYNIAANMDLYRLGYEEGLKEYCHPSIVFQLGRNGSAYPSQCPDDLTDQLKISYRYGRDIYDLHDDIRNTQRLLSGKNKELKQAEKVLSEYTTEIVTQGTPTSQGIELQDEDLPNQIDGIKEEINDLSVKLSTRQTQLERLVSVLQ